MTKIERIRKGVRQVQLLLPEDQHRRLKAHAAINGMTITDLLRSRIMDVIGPMAVEDIAYNHAMAVPR